MPVPSDTTGRCRGPIGRREWLRLGGLSLGALCGGLSPSQLLLEAAPRLVTDAPWFVRVRAWCPRGVDAVVIHWINYQQDEEAAFEIPSPVGPLQAECEIPGGFQAERIEWHYPEMREPVVLEHVNCGPNVRFAIPRLIVYGMSVLYLRGK